MNAQEYTLPKEAKTTCPARINLNLEMWRIPKTFSFRKFIILIVKAKETKKNETATSPVRSPAVAGSFYPSSEKDLNATLSALLNQAEIISSTESAKILIVPHAGISYSGQVAAWGFKQIEGKKFTRIILLGASHRAFFNHAAVYNKGLWETPLGKVEVDENLAKMLIDDKEIVADLSPHQDEHSLEIELIFLQKVLKNFRILPILLSQTSEDLVNNLAQKISDNLDENTFLVISSDLSHYPPYEVANKVDGETIKAILSGKQEIFAKTVAIQESAGYQGVETCACGAEAVKVGLKVGEILGLEFKKIKYANSGDPPSPSESEGFGGAGKSQVVGYAAIVGYRKAASATQPLDESAQKEALTIARKTLEDYLKSPISPTSPISPKNKSLLELLGAFVTLRNKDELRGCIGEFEPKEPLYQVIQNMAIEAATKDPRFLPVTKQELPEIKIEISVMTPKRKISHWQEIELGKHGVVVQKGFNAGTFLPQVATETGWNLEEFLSRLCAEKAGLPTDCYKNPTTNIFVFDAQVFAEQ